MEESGDMNGQLETRYSAFLETISQIRPRLHRYCARMTGSALDGEDVVQDALFEAYRKLDQFDDSRSLVPWLFRIAHNRCIDFLRRRQVRNAAEAEAAPPEFVYLSEPVSIGVRPAIEHLVLTLPPKERACVLLKDVFDYSLGEIAELVDSTVGGVKAALSRGRAKLAESTAPSLAENKPRPKANPVLSLYVERFNGRDWDGVRELIRADARLKVTDAFSGQLSDSPYFSNYERLSIPWKMAVGEIDDEPVVIALRLREDMWVPYSAVRATIEEGLIVSLVDYSHCPWLMENAASVMASG